MSTEIELRELESIFGKRNVKHFVGKSKQELEKKLWKYVYRHNVNIKLLICRRKRYSLYY